MHKRCLVFLLAALVASGALAQDKKRIERAADLPRFTYKIDGKLEDLVRDPVAFSRFADQVRRDDQSVLDQYDIADKSAQRGLLGVLARIDFLEGRYADAARRADEIRALEEKPADIVLPNLLTVGAVDKAGDEASFTSYGPTVKVHANGYQVESYLPGGDRVALSGTSMASPQVTGLAAKMLAVNPKLTPAQLIAIIEKTSEKTADGRRHLIDPKKAVAAAQSAGG